MQIETYEQKPKSMRNIKIFKHLPSSVFLLALICIFACGCRGKQEEVADKIKLMQSCPVDLCLDKLECVRNMGQTKSSGYTMVVYVDSSQCTPCALNHLQFWNKLIEDAQKGHVDISYTFILGTKNQEKEDIAVELETNSLKGCIYIDTASVFISNNPQIPKEREYHSFLIDAKNKVLLVGNPINNDNVRKLYKYILKI